MTPNERFRPLKPLGLVVSILLVATAFDVAAGDDSSSASTPTELTEGHSAPSWLAFELDDLAEQRAESARPWHGFLDVGSMRAGLYELPKGATDRQRPHSEDEIYYVIAGKAVLEVDGERQAVTPGSVLFVRAAVEHRFVDIEEPLKVLVVFASQPARDNASGETRKDSPSSSE